MTAQQIDVHGLPAKLRAEADELERLHEKQTGFERNFEDHEKAAVLFRVADELEAALRQSGESLADTQRAIIEAAERRGYERCKQDALRQSGEAVYQVEFGSVGWLDTDKPTFDWRVQQGSRKCRVLYTTTPATPATVVDDELDNLILRYGNERAAGRMSEAAEIYMQISSSYRPPATSGLVEAAKSALGLLAMYRETLEAGMGANERAALRLIGDNLSDALAPHYARGGR